MIRPPTDYELLKAIYERHRKDYALPDAGTESNIFVPIDINAVARSLGAAPDSVFGRLYYDLDPKYASHAPGDEGKKFFSAKVGRNANCINVPHLEAVVAQLALDRRRTGWTVGLSLGSLAVAVASLIVSIVFAAAK
jgi:hypothetical protein